jgi:very-short-patch-repair endonuclease/transposase-like protein
MNCKYCGKECKNNSSLSCHEKSCEKFSLNKENIISLYINNNKSIREIAKELQIYKTLINNLLKETNNIRTKSESHKIAHKNHPENFKFTEESKQKCREIRLEWMKNNPDKTAWRTSNFSYPEKIFYNKLIELGYDKKYLIIREKSLFPYFIDFAFEDYKLAIEIDGSQHLLPERIESDKRKDDLLMLNGWSVIRFSESEIKINIDNVFKVIEEKINNLNVIEVLKVGILKEPKKYIKKERNEYGFTKKQIINHINDRKVKERPPIEQLELDVEELGYCGTGRKYSVSDTAIRKWIKAYKNNIDEKLKI